VDIVLNIIEHSVSDICWRGFAIRAPIPGHELQTRASVRRAPFVIHR